MIYNGNMERLGGQGEFIKPVYYLTPEQIAIQALVDEMIRRQDEQTFAALDRILEGVRNDGQRADTNDNA